MTTITLTPDQIFDALLDWLDNGGDTLAGKPLHFRHETIHCGTAACIAGAIGDLLAPDRRNVEVFGYHWRDLAHAVGMNPFDFDYLTDPQGSFPGAARGHPRPAGWPERNREVTAEWAARTIRHYRETGVVDWAATAEEAA